MILIAMDRASVRRIDANGFLHIKRSAISKANVCPYFGREIPDWQQLGLDASKVYHLYRDPEELARAAPTFDNLPVLSEHMPVDATEFPREITIGSTGTDARFGSPYLENSLVVYDQASIDGIEANHKKELSCAYRYRADMTPGRTPDGLSYDGVMRDIIGNHVALVIEGRAGPDVVIGDEVMKLTSRTALMVSGALAALVRPKLAQDAKVDLSDALKGVDAAALAKDGAPKAIADKVVALATPHLAADQALDVSDVETAISSVQISPLAEDSIPDAPVVKIDPPAPKVDPSPKADPVVTMDQATVDRLIADAVAKARTDTRADAAAMDQAKRDVQPFVGEVVGMDSAAAVYKFALDHAKVDLTGVDESAYPALVKMLPNPGDRPTIANDHMMAGNSVLTKVVPNLPPLLRS